MSTQAQNQSGASMYEQVREHGGRSIESTGANITPRAKSDLPQNVVNQFYGGQRQQDTIRHNAAIPDESWKSVDDLVYDTMDQTLVLIRDLRSAGLVTQVDIRARSTEWHVKDDNHEASIVMDPDSTDDQNTSTFDLRGAPIPIVQDDFSVGFRDRPINGPIQGEAYDEMEADAAARSVAETFEYLGFNGWPASEPGDGYTLYGLTTHPDINTGQLSDWGGGGSVTPTIRKDIRTMAQDIEDDGFYPAATGFWLYLSRDYENHLDDIDPLGNGNLTVRDRVKNLNNIGRIRTADFLPPQSALMFRPTRDVVDLGIAAEEQVIQWTGPGGFTDHFKVMGSITPRVKSTLSGQSGIAFYQTP